MKSFIDVFKASEEGLKDVDYDKATIKNKYGENIHIKFENDRIYIHHEDATDDFMTIDEFLKSVILDSEELVIIELTIKKIHLKNEIKSDYEKI